MNTKEVREQEEYWLNKFKGEIPKLNLATDYTRSSILDFEAKKVKFTLDKDIVANLNSLAKSNNVTLSDILFTTYNILLHKYTGKEDIVVGWPVSSDLENKEYNILPLRNNPIITKTFKKLLLEVKENTIQAHANKDYKFNQLVEKLAVNEEKKIFDTLFSLNNDLKAVKRVSDRISILDLILSGAVVDNKIKFDIEYNTKLFKRETISRMIRHFKNILKEIIKDPNSTLSEINMLSDKEKKQLLHEFNDTRTEYPKDKTVYELFEEQVEKNPDNIAVVYEDQKLTYEELNTRANQLARILKKKGVKEDTPVGIMVNRSIEMAIGVLAILKAGGAYLPIDPKYPEERMKYMIEDSKPDILLVQKEFMNKVKFDLDIINLEDRSLYQGDSSNLAKSSTPTNMAYIMYTSGSTGRPKGVMVEHQNVVRLVKNTNYVNFSEGDRILQTGAIVFDATTFELWGALLNGLRLYLVDEMTILNVDKLGEALAKNKITTLWLTSPLFSQLAAEKSEIFSGLKYLLVGGDVLNPQYINKVRNECEGIKIINGYGPTENTTFSTTYYIDKDYETDIPIGKPIANSTTYIVDENNNLQPIGVVGELCVGGDGVSRGYLNRAEKTAENFVENPFVPGEKMYRTGDLARWLPDGNIEFLGRKDYQVKIRGFRIELGAIEGQLLKHEAIKEAVVIAKEDTTKYLCGYITAKKEFTIAELKKYLSEELPDYMIPSYFIQLDEMPLNQNGKIDRESLPKPDGNISTGVEYVAPKSKIERRLLKICQQILDIEKIGMNNDFFELGGDSLKMMNLINKIQQELNVQISLKEVLKRSKFKELAEYINNAEDSKSFVIEKTEQKEYYPLSSAQERMMIENQFDKNSINYNEPFAWILEGKLDRDRLENAFIQLIKHHESLRTGFESLNGEFVQKVYEEVDFRIEYIEKDEEEIEETLEELGVPFDLSKAPLMRVRLVKIAENRHLLALVFHHIIIDGASMEILMKEISKLYKGESLTDLNTTYKDYAIWQKEKFSKMLKEQEDYWLEKFSGELPVLEMPTDYSRPAVKGYQGANFNFNLEKELTDKLKRMAKENNTTLHMILLAMYNVLLYKYTGQEDIIVGNPIVGRPHADLENIIGMFVNTLAMRNYPQGDKNFEEFLQEVKENSLEAYEHQDYQFEELVNKLDIEKDPSRNPLFDTVFVLQSMNLSEFNLDNLNVTPYNFRYDIAKFDITLEATEKEEGIRFDLEYCTQLFKRETIKSLAEHYLNIIKELVEKPQIELSEVNMLSSKEKNKILDDYNDTVTDYPKEKTLQEIFEEQVEKAPTKVAITLEGKELTYEELNERANQLARSLRAKGVKANTVVGLMVKRSIEMMVGIWGILKAGGTYLPIDPTYPEERINYMLEDSEAELLLTHRGLADEMEFTEEIIDITDSSLYQEDKSNLKQINNPEDVAYIIYTSGTTGKPKGILTMHYNISRVVKDTNYIDIKSEDRLLQLSNYAFDGSTFDIFGALLNGAKLVLIKKDKILEIDELAKVIKDEEITVFFVTTALFNVLIDTNIDSLKGVRKILFGGERISVPHAAKAVEYLGKDKIIHVYGPTESTVYATYYFINEVNSNADNIPIGRPLANTQIYVLDQDNNVQPLGVPGELCITGSGLAKGYLNRPEKTAESFVENPFGEGKMYRTGDLVKMLPDGNIEFLGRIDHQVKVRGFRIELGEIQSKLLEHNEVKEAIVIAKKKERGSKYLCAYLVSNKMLTITELRNYLAEDLPDYMIPSYFVQLDEMPLNHNGKVDRKSLPEPDLSLETRVEYVAPKTELEKKLAEMWQEILKLDQIGIYDNFLDLGGTSLSIIQLMQMIKLECEVSVPIEEIYATPTIEGLAERINQIKSGALDEVSAALDEVSASSGEIVTEEYDTSKVERLSVNKINPENILLTGATGFLGSHLLRDLLVETEANIYCLIRAKNGNSPTTRLKERLSFYFGNQLDKYLEDRIIVIEGNLIEDNLGLREDKYKGLADIVDTVIHTAADVRHYGEYKQFEKVNVYGTQKLLDFCFAGRNKRFHHTSTLGIIGANRKKDIFKESDLDIGQNFIGNVYGKSKFEAEKLVYEARNKGLQASIYRMGLLVGRYEDGFFQENIEENRFYNNLKGLISLGMVSESYLRYKTDLSPIDNCSQAMVKLILWDEIIGHNFHIMNPDLASMKQVINVINNEGYLIEEKTNEEFYNYVSSRIKQDNFDREISIVFNDLASGNHEFIEENTMEKISTKFTVNALEKAGFIWSEVNIEFIEKLLHHCEEVGYIEKE